MLGFLCKWGFQGLVSARKILLSLLEHAIDCKSGYVELMFFIYWYETLINIAAVKTGKPVGIIETFMDVNEAVDCTEVDIDWLYICNNYRNKLVHNFPQFDFIKLIQHIQSIGEISFLRLCQYVFAEYYDEELCSEFYKDLGVKAAISSEVFVEAVETVKGSNDNKRLLSI